MGINGGIYRDVHLTVTEQIAVDLWGVYAPYKKLEGTDRRFGGDFLMNIGFHFVNDRKNQSKFIL